MKYKRYKLIDNTTELLIDEKGNPFVLVRDLKKLDSKWKIIANKVALQEIIECHYVEINQNPQCDKCIFWKENTCIYPTWYPGLKNGKNITNYE